MSTTEGPQVSPIMRWFDWEHLPEELQDVSRKFYRLAWSMERNLAPGPEKSVTLRKLLEAKDAAVRASMHEVRAALLGENYNPNCNICKNLEMGQYCPIHNDHDPRV